MVFDKGDRVVAQTRIGTFFRPVVPKGTPGVVSGLSYSAGTVSITVAFANGRTEVVSVNQIRPLDVE